MIDAGERFCQWPLVWCPERADRSVRAGPRRLDVCDAHERGAGELLAELGRVRTTKLGTLEPLPVLRPPRSTALRWLAAMIGDERRN